MARGLEIPVEQPADINAAEAREWIARARPDAVVVCAFGALLREPLLSEHEVVNVHPSLLPRWRGAAPIERALMAGDVQTGVSIMRLTAGLDSGPVCLQASEAIRAEDTYGSLASRLQELSADLLIAALDDAPRYVEQNEAGVTYAEKIGPEDRVLDPGRPAAVLERIVRALSPHIGARATLADGVLIGVRRAKLADEDPVRDGMPPGVHAYGERVLLVCREGALELLEVQPPGGRAMDGAAFLRGHGLPGVQK
jgi:methionyl-tRNA formyltransferase